VIDKRKRKNRKEEVAHPQINKKSVSVISGRFGWSCTKILELVRSISMKWNPFFFSYLTKRTKQLTYNRYTCKLRSVYIHRLSQTHDRIRIRVVPTWGTKKIRDSETKSKP